MARLAVAVSPKSASDAIVGWRSDAAGKEELHVRVRAAPEGGKATKAVCDLLAKALRVPKSSVICARGAASRHKQIEVAGISDDEARARLQ